MKLFLLVLRIVYAENLQGCWNGRPVHRPAGQSRAKLLYCPSSPQRIRHTFRQLDQNDELRRARDAVVGISNPTRLIGPASKSSSMPSWRHQGMDIFPGCLTYFIPKSS